MFHRFPTWWRALSVVLLSLATVTWPSAAQAGTTPSFTVVHQSAFTSLSPRGDARFSATIHTSAASSPPLVRVSIYPRVIERSQLAPILDGAGLSSPFTSSTGDFALSCVAHDEATFTVQLQTTPQRMPSTHCESRPARLHLACVTSQCDGVYPLSFSVTVDNITTVKWSLIAVRASDVARPLHVDVVATLDPSTPPDSVAAARVLDVIARNPSVPLTLSADYQSLSALDQSSSTRPSRVRAALVKALVSPLHRVIEAPPSTIDFAGLVRIHLPSQVGQQLTLSAQLARNVTGRYADAPVFLSGVPTLADVRALASAHVSEIVVPDESLSPVPSTTLNWGAPFHLPGLAGVTALATDAPLEQLATDRAIEPGRRAALELASLAFLHYEAPNTPAARTVVLIVPIGSNSSQFVTDLLSGFRSNPYVTVTSLSPSFNSSLVASNGAPVTRTLASTAVSIWSSHNVATLRALIDQFNSFNQAAADPSLTDTLDVALASAETRGDTGGRQAALNSAAALLDAQLTNFSVDQSTITLTGPGTALPITLLSRATYPVTAVVHLITDRLDFPKGNTVTVLLNSSTKSIRIPTSNHRGSDLTLQVVVTSPNGQLILARAAIQVRIAGNSVVGYLLSSGSLVVLGFWWIRTHRRKSKGQHAR